MFFNLCRIWVLGEDSYFGRLKLARLIIWVTMDITRLKFIVSLVRKREWVLQHLNPLKVVGPCNGVNPRNINRQLHFTVFSVISFSLISPGSFSTVLLFFLLSVMQGEVIFFFLDYCITVKRINVYFVMFPLMWLLGKWIVRRCVGCHMVLLLGRSKTVIEAVLFFSECTASLLVLFAASVISAPVFMLQWSLSL